MTIRIDLLSSPRSVSTALMYSFRQRADTRVFDEPLYGHYLRHVPDADHPGRASVVAATEPDADVAITQHILGPTDTPVLFLKNMAQHFVEPLNLAFLDSCVNPLLLRDPREVLTTIVRQIPNPTMRDIGIEKQAWLYDELVARDQRPPIIDSRLLLENPQGVLRELCSLIGIEWDPAMLSWPPGPKPEDGVWAGHWYQNAHKSTGFAPYMPKTEALPAGLDDLADRAVALYEPLRALAIVGK